MKSKENLTTFDECKLERKKYADVLTSIVATYKDGFVLAVNGKWGTGKTTFMKMWQNELNNQGYRTIFFNAWENDFTSEPLVALLGEIKSLIHNSDETIVDAAKNKFKDVKEKFKNFNAKSAVEYAKLAGHAFGLGNIINAGEELCATPSDFYDLEIDNYENKKKALKSFRDSLKEFVAFSCRDKSSDGPDRSSCNSTTAEQIRVKPLIFIIDELDRCRPDYAVEVLEKIKHLFSVDGIVFVLSIDKEQLSHAIRGHYGSENIDSPEYLRRFIDLEYTLPEPDYSRYIDYKFSTLEISVAYGFDADATKKTIAHISRNKNCSLRQIDKILSHTKIALQTNRANQNHRCDIIFLLIILKEFHANIYSMLKNKQTDFELLNNQIDHMMFANYNPTNNQDDYLYYLFPRLAYLMAIFCKTNINRTKILEQIESKKLSISEVLLPEFAKKTGLQSTGLPHPICRQS